MKKISLIIAILFINSQNIIFAQWTQVGGDIDGEAADDRSGIAISLARDGNRVAIGAFSNDDNGEDAGHVRISAETGGAWIQVGNDIDGEAAGDISGATVSISADGKRVAIGARENDGNGERAGHARVYSESGGIWTQIGNDLDGENTGDGYGESVSLSADGKRVAIGGFFNDGNGVNSGHVRIFSESGGVWTQVGSDIDGEAANDWSGENISLSADGKRVAIGAKYNDGAGESSGHIRVFSESGSVWTQVGSDIDGEAAGDNIGGWTFSLSADGNRVAIGSAYNNENAGHTRVYSESGGTWTQVGNDIDGEAAGDRSGFSVSLSADGKVVAIGESVVKQVRVFTESGGVWSQIGNSIANYGNSVFSVSLSGYGDKVAIGAPFNYDWSGQVGVFHTYALDVADHESSNSIPTTLTLFPAYPNPFNPSTTISYGIPDVKTLHATSLLIQIYDITGKLITTLFNGEQTPGWYSVIWNGMNQNSKLVPAGLYFSRIVAGNDVKTNKLMLLK